MNNLRNIPMILLAWGICAFQASAAEESKAKPPEPMQATLFPGETLTYQGVSVTWVVEPGEQRPKSDTGITTPTGHLKFVGPTAKLDNVPLPFRVQYIQGVSYGGSRKPEMKPGGLTGRKICLYLDQVVFDTAGSSSGAGNRVDFLMYYTEKERHRDAGPGSEGFLVSYSCPAQINQWELTISEKAVRYPDGSQFFQITARNTETGEKAVIPAAENVTKKAGRFTFRIHKVYPETRTIQMAAKAESDPSIRGRDAYAMCGLLKTVTLDEFLGSLSKEYGFEVEWVAMPEGDTESVQYCRKSTNSGLRAGEQQGVLRDLLGGFLKHFGPPVNAEWRDATHLRVWAADYAKVAEGKRQEAERSQELGKLKALLYQKYSPITKIYRLQNLSAKTAQELLGSQTPRNYYLFEMAAGVDLSGGGKYPGSLRLALLEEGKYYSIGAVPVEDLGDIGHQGKLNDLIGKRLQAQTNESVIADERSNSLIVSAAAQAHEKIAELLQASDRMIETRAAASPILRFRVEVVLLQGRKESVKSAEGTPLSFLTNGILAEISVRPGDRVNPGDVIARLDTSDVETERQKYELAMERSRSQCQAEQLKLDRAKAREKAGVTEGTEVTDAEQSLEKARYDLAREEIEMKKLQDQMERCTLRSPSDGTVSWVGELRPGQSVGRGDLVARFIPASPSAEKVEKPGKDAKKLEKAEEKKPEKKEPTLVERYGISAEDMQLLGAKSLTEMGRGVLSLSGDKGETGRAVVNLTPQYQCELQYQDYRSPYLIARARLQSPAASGGAAKPVIENTVYLEPGKPSAEGITNLSEALILVVQLHDIQAMGLGQAPEGEQEVTLKTGLPYRKIGSLVLSLREVSANDAQNDRDDTCVLDVTTPTGGTETIALDEGGPSQSAAGWRFEAIDVRPTDGANSTQGTARVRISRPSAGR